MSARTLENPQALKAFATGERVTFRARVMRFWEVGGLCMSLVGDASALSRVEIGEAKVQEGKSYEFRNAVVREYPGGWHSASLDERSSVVPLNCDVPVSQDEEYIERTFKILSGIQRKKGREAGRLAPWRHPTARDRDSQRRLFVSDVGPNTLHQLRGNLDEAVLLRVHLGVPHELLFGLASNDVTATGAAIHFGAINNFSHFFRLLTELPQAAM